jgi:trigger factor
METTVETTEPHTVRLTVEVPVDEVEKDLDQAYRKIASQVRIPGFRKGKAPKQIIDAQVGRDVVVDEFLTDAVPVYYRQAVREHDLAPITDPELDLTPLEDGKPLVFTATVEVRPRLELSASDYEGIKVDRPPAEVSDEDVDGWVDRLRERFAELEPVARPADTGDYVTIDLTTTQAGERLDAASRSDYLYLVGSEEFGPALDAQLAGKKPGHILKFDAELPDRFGPEVGGRPASFQVLVKDVKARRLPAADDEFAKTAGEFDTLAELRDDLRSKLGELKEQETDAAVRDLVLQGLIDSVEVELPETLVEEETQHRLRHAGEQAERMGLTLEQMLEAQGWDEARLEADSRAHAVRGIMADLVLEGVARAEDLQVDAEELGAEIGSLARAYGRDPKELAKQLDRTGQIVTLAGDIIRNKALDLLVERADIQTEAPKAPQAPKENP